jgi:N-acetyl-anhydromuramyl-L-alanine amidase AmpD
MTTSQRTDSPVKPGWTWPVYTEINIDAPAALVWSIITNPDDYPSWNPFIARISLRSDDIQQGVEFDLDCQMTDSQLISNEKEVVLEVDESRRVFRIGTSRTKGRPGIASNRCQQCLEQGHGTRYINYEEFRGALGPLVNVLYRRNLQRAFAKHNLALKRHAEALHRAG